MNENNQKKKLLHVQLKKIILPRNLRLAILLISTIFLIFFVLFTLFSTQPIQQSKIIDDYEYLHSGSYEYTAFLKNNTIYNNQSELYQDQGKLFREIIDHINLKYSYTFYGYRNITFEQAYYQIIPTIRTNYWNKTFAVIVNETTIQSPSFNIIFPLNLSYYEKLLSRINNEINFQTNQQSLEISTKIFLTAKTINDTIHDTFVHNIMIPLTSKIVNFDGNFSRTKPVLKSHKEIIEVSGYRTQVIFLSVLSTFIFILIITFLILTKSSKILSKKQKQFLKIKKKYGKWMAEIKEKINGTSFKIIYTKTIEDLIKISEEISKTILYYTDEKNNNYLFYVIDEEQFYVFEF